MTSKDFELQFTAAYVTTMNNIKDATIKYVEVNVPEEALDAIPADPAVMDGIIASQEHGFETMKNLVEEQVAAEEGDTNGLQSVIDTIRKNVPEHNRIGAAFMRLLDENGNLTHQCIYTWVLYHLIQDYKAAKQTRKEVL